MASKLFVGNLPWTTTSDDLQQLFSQYGSVVSAEVKADKFTGRSRGFGFVEMSSEAEAEAAKVLDGNEVGGRKIVVKEPLPMKERPPRRDFGGHGHGGGHRDNY